ncbi:MAG: hypothetical protein MNPFHGCM_02539 [Gemmatimonadaceae bacterium]|nr:hypothetical protein [Gemmatimonadaceae bacterium]
MPGLLTPSRQRGIEYLDSPDVDPALRQRSHRDIRLSNTLFGGLRAFLLEFERIVPDLPQRATLLDIGTGAGDMPAQSVQLARRHGIELTAIGLDAVPALVVSTTRRIPLGVCAHALALPFAARSIDVVCCSQLLHHFDDANALIALGELHRVARRYVIVSDLRRNWLAVAGLWGASFPLGFHPVSRHDGVVSILRGFTIEELRALVRRAVGVDADVRARLGFRITATWAAVTS